MYETSCQSRFDARYWMLGAGALGRPRGMEKTLESPLDSKEIQLVNPKGSQSWIFTGRTGAETEAPILWPPDVTNWLIGKDPDAGKDWRQEKKGTTEVGWCHQVDGHESEQAPGIGDGQGSLVCCSPWITKNQIWLSKWTELKGELKKKKFLIAKTWK